MNDLLDLQKQQIEALQKELEKKNLALSTAKNLIIELYTVIIQVQHESVNDDLAHDEIINL